MPPFSVSSCTALQSARVTEVLRAMVGQLFTSMSHGRKSGVIMKSAP